MSSTDPVIEVPDEPYLEGEHAAVMADSAARPPTGRVCRECGEPLPPGAHQATRYCDEHRPPPPGRKRRDKAPKTRSRPAVKVGVSDAQLEQMLTEILGLPAMPAAMLWHCDYCAMNFTTQARPLAQQIVLFVADKPWIRSKLELLFTASGSLALVFAVAAYVLPPLIHHGGLPVPHELVTLVGAEPVPGTVPSNGAAGSAPPFTTSEPAEATAFSYPTD